MSLLSPAKYFLGLSAVLVAVSIVLLIVPGPKLSIDFTGGTLMELQLPEGKTKEELSSALASFAPDADMEPVGNTAIAHIDATLGNTTELQFTTIEPTV